MTREKAIKSLQFVRNALTDGMEMAKAYDMAIESLKQESTTKNDLGVDAISRADARKAIIEYQYSDGFCEKHNIDHSINTSMALLALSDLPSVTPQEPRWIPVSERLPEDGQNVLFCDIDNDIMVGYHVKGRPNTHFSQDGTYEDMKNVRAWMSLPEPFEPQESEDA